MIFKETEISGSYIIEPEKFIDDRGFFARGYCEREFKNQGISFNIAQANIGYSKNQYTLRGLHYQAEPHREAKLVRCTSGALFDVIIDLRTESPTYKEWIGVELTEKKHTMFYVPEGCAHGYQTLEDNTEVFYMVSAFYAPDHERGVRWDDPAFNIEWKETKNMIISEKDRQWPDYEG